MPSATLNDNTEVSVPSDHKTEKLVTTLEREGSSLGKAIAVCSRELADHPVYSAVHTLDDVKVFMTFHVWCVWDFMSLAKAVQQGVTCTTVPWLPPKDANLVALANEIVSMEEADILPHGGHASHFEIYVRAMHEVGATTEPIEAFLHILRERQSLDSALSRSGAPAEAQRFVKNTLQIAQGALPGIIAAFCLGREEIVPEMFKTLLRTLPKNDAQYGIFRWYLRRHVEVDTTSHGPASALLFHRIVGKTSPDEKQAALQVALDSLLARKNLLDATNRAIEKNRK